MKKIRCYLKKHSYGINTVLIALLNSAILYYCLELGNKNPLMNGFLYSIINTVTVFTVQTAIYLVCQRWWISSVVTGIPLTALSIANYYTLAYRNLPISTQDIHNAGTALSVLKSYSFGISLYVAAIILLFSLSIYLTVILYRREKGKKSSLKNAALKNTCLLLFCLIFVNAVYLGKHPIKPRDTFIWSWEDSYYTYGYAASSIEILQKSLKLVDKPAGYSDEKAEKLAAETEVTPTSGKTPDVIFILNETFYDLRDILDIETDTEFMPFVDRLDDAIKGRCVVAGTGGGTNKSEYELLTSNSLQLMPGITPFNYLDFTDANSIVSYMKNLGYSTYGAHCAQPLNYSRSKVYPILGFDKIMFDKDFSGIEHYGSRWYATDESVYRNLTENYEQMGDGPRFMYMLTIQNHGGWELNPSDKDIVHSKTDFGEYTDQINEYLSCIKLSDEAFKNLTEYFSKSDRPVVICMVGDHAPAFASELIDKDDINQVVKLRSTPYIIWSNFGLEDIDGENGETVSMPYMVPKTLKAAQIKLSPFYSYMLDMKAEVPVVSSFNIYRDKNGEMHKYTDTTPYTDKLCGYFDLVYNNAAGGKNVKRAESAFLPK